MGYTPHERLLIEPHFLPSIPYFHAAYHASTISFEVCSKYRKQTFQNRAYLLTSQGIHKLIVPVQHPLQNLLYKEIKINYSSQWVRQHMRTLATVYGKTPFYDVIAELLHPIFLRQPTFLVDLNIALFESCFTLLQMEKYTTRSTDYSTETPPRTLNLRGHFHPKKSIDSSYEKFLDYPRHFTYAPPPPQLSIIDLLCIQGPYSHRILKGGIGGSFIFNRIGR